MAARRSGGPARAGSATAPSTRPHDRSDGPERPPGLLPWSFATTWWLFVDAPTPWSAAFVGLWAVFVATLGLKGQWDFALVAAAVPVVFVLARMMRVRRRMR